MTIVPDFDRAGPVAATPLVGALGRGRAVGVGGSRAFWQAKSIADIVGALLLLPVVIAMAGLLLVLNPLFNPGPLLYRQVRMGQDFAPFTALKFRTMRAGADRRGADDPVEVERITPLGAILRRMGLDELPQAINVLRGEMSLIGPRPDCIRHARTYLDAIPEYHRRFAVRPGLSGLAQITLGYAVGTTATRAKAQADLDYIARAGFWLDAWIVWRTLLTIATGRGD